MQQSQHFPRQQSCGGWGEGRPKEAEHPRYFGGLPSHMTKAPHHSKHATADFLYQTSSSRSPTKCPVTSFLLCALQSISYRMPRGRFPTKCPTGNFILNVLWPLSYQMPHGRIPIKHATENFPSNALWPISYQMPHGWFPTKRPAAN